MSSLSSTTNPLTGAPSSANHKRIRAQAKELPVSQCMDRLMEAIKKNVVTIVVAETGSGKTTQIPLQIMLQLMPSKSDKKLALTQPRRLAAQHVAERIADEADVSLGTVVGVKYKDRDLSAAGKTLRHTNVTSS